MSPLFLQRCLRSSQQDHEHPGSQVGEGARNLPFTGAVFIDPHFQYGPVSRPIAVLHTPNAQPVWISFPKETHLLQKPPVFNAPPHHVCYPLVPGASSPWNPEAGAGSCAHRAPLLPAGPVS